MNVKPLNYWQRWVTKANINRLKLYRERVLQRKSERELRQDINEGIDLLMKMTEDYNITETDDKGKEIEITKESLTKEYEEMLRELDNKVQQKIIEVTEELERQV